MIEIEFDIPEEMLKTIDEWVEDGKFKNRKEAIKTILSFEKKE